MHRLTVRVLSPGKSCHIDNRFSYVERLGHRAKMTKVPAKASGIFARLINIFKLVKEIQRAEADIYHAHYAISEATILAVILGKRPLIVSTMGGDILLEEQGDPTRVMKAIAKLILSSAHAVTAKSKFNAEAIKKLTDHHCEPEIISWGVDCEIFKEIPEDEKHNSCARGLAKNAPDCVDDYIMLQPRGLAEVYNTYLLLDACKQLKDKQFKFKLILCNSVSAPESFDVWQRVDELNLRDHVQGLDRIEQTQLNYWYNKADLVVSIAKSDGLPMTVLESLATNTKVLLGRLPHLESEFSAREVRWTELNSNDIAENIEALIAAKNSGAVYSTGRKYVQENFNLDHDLVHYQNLLTKVNMKRGKYSFSTRVKLACLFIADGCISLLTRMLGRQFMSRAYIRQL